MCDDDDRAPSPRDRPELADKPVAVGGESMISTTNYHARLKGVRSAMPGFIGRKLCPELVRGWWRGVAPRNEFHVRFVLIF